MALAVNFMWMVYCSLLTQQIYLQEVMSELIFLFGAEYQPKIEASESVAF